MMVSQIALTIQFGLAAVLLAFWRAFTPNTWPNRFISYVINVSVVPPVSLWNPVLIYSVSCYGGIQSIRQTAGPRFRHVHTDFPTVEGASSFSNTKGSLVDGRRSMDRSIASGLA